MVDAAMKWEVLLKGEIGEEEDTGGYELSVIRKDNELGRRSWGWPSEEKIILFGTGIGENSEIYEEFALMVANGLCDFLNNQKEVTIKLAEEKTVEEEEEEDEEDESIIECPYCGSLQYVEFTADIEIECDTCGKVLHLDDEDDEFFQPGALVNMSKRRVTNGRQND